MLFCTALYCIIPPIDTPINQFGYYVPAQVQFPYVSVIPVGTLRGDFCVEDSEAFVWD